MTSKGDSNGSVFIDLDSFAFGPIDEIAPRHPSPSAKQIESFQEFGTIHYLLRSRVTLASDCNEDAWAHFQDFSKACAVEAARYVGNWDQVPNPAWIGDFRQKLKDSGRADPSAIDNIGFGFNLAPKIQAYCFPSERRIEVSAVTLIHLRTINLLLCTLASELRHATGSLAKERGPEEVSNKEAWLAGENFVDFLLPHLFSLYFPSVDYSSLPIPRAQSADMFMYAKIGAFVQMEFMLAHECAHLLFHEKLTPGAELEKEADTFAYELLFDNETFWKNDSGILFTFCRWFFLYLALDRIIGAVLSNYDIDWVDLPIRDRDLWLMTRARDVRFDSAEHRDWQLLGDAILFQAKAKLHERGVDWIRSEAKKFEERHCFHKSSTFGAR